MRCTQVIGLTNDAKKFLNNNSDEFEILSSRAYTSKGKKYASAASYGMFDDGPDLYEYNLRDGRVVQEFVQAAPWSSGPCIFLALRVRDSGEVLFHWSDEDIQNC